MGLFLLLSVATIPVQADTTASANTSAATPASPPVSIMPGVVPTTLPVIMLDPAPSNAPPYLLDPDTRPFFLEPLPLVPAPAITMSEPIPMARARNCISRDSTGRFMGWMDYQHCVFSGRTLAGARWFDDLFGDWYDAEAKLLVSAIMETTFVESHSPNTVFRIRASADLPNAKKRLRLVISNDSDVEDRVVGQDALSRLNNRPSQVSAAVRLTPFERAGFKSDIDVGVRNINPPDIFTRFRVRNHWSLSRDSILRFGQTLRYGSASEGRSISQLDLERVMDENSVAIFSSGYEYDQQSSKNGFIWGHGISLSHVLGDTRSLGYGFTLSGHTAPNWRGENYGPWIVYRSSFLRPWLFYELEPRVTWYRDHDWGSVASIVLRLEVQLGRN